MFTDVLIIANVTERLTVFLYGEFKCCWEMRALNAGYEREKMEPVQTNFTDEVISETNAANERAYGKKGEGEREREGEIL